MSSSYDGDEVMPKVTSHVETHQTIEPPEEHSNFVNGTNGDNIQQDAKHDVQQNTQDQKMQSPPGDGEDSTATWQNGQNVADTGNDFGDMAVEQESHGTGIKEDG